MTVSLEAIQLKKPSNCKSNSKVYSLKEIFSYESGTQVNRVPCNITLLISQIASLYKYYQPQVNTPSRWGMQVWTTST